MRSFKQYLTEESFTVDTCPYFSFVTDIYGNEIKYVSADIDTAMSLIVTNNEYEVITDVDDQLEICIDILDGDYSQRRRLRYNRDIETKLYQIGKTELGHKALIENSFIVFRHKLANSNIVSNSRNVRLFLANLDNVTLKDINKNIPDCSYLVINNADKIVSNALSLLKIKPLAEIFISVHSDNLSKVEWLNIIRKHLQTKDINDCQEELIEKGYKDYAKF